IPSPKLTGNTHGFYGTVGAFKPNQQEAHKSHGRYSITGAVSPSGGDDDHDTALEPDCAGDACDDGAGHDAGGGSLAGTGGS
ncbi:MAG: hypothetical protein WCG26_10940, partial [Chloroflexales bacterium]